MQVFPFHTLQRCSSGVLKGRGSSPMFLASLVIIFHGKLVYVNLDWRVIRFRKKERSPISMIDANILNKQSQTTDEGRSPPAWGLGEVLTTPHRKNWPCYETDICT